MPHDCQQQVLNVGDAVDVALNGLFLGTSGRRAHVTFLDRDVCLCEYARNGRRYVVPTSHVRKVV